jgi:hypothetical protein
MRALKIVVATFAMVFCVSLLAFLAALWIAGPSTADRVWSSPYIIVLYPVTLFVAARWLR